LRPISEQDWNTYADRVDQEIQKLIQFKQEEFSPFFSDLHSLFLFIGFLIDEGELFILKGKNSSALSILLARTCYALNGVCATLQIGAITEAGTSLRTLFEIYLSTEMILLQDSELRSQLFNEFHHASAYYYLRSVETFEDKQGETIKYGPNSKERDDIRKQWHSVCGHFPDHPRQANYWWWFLFAERLSEKKLQAVLKGEGRDPVNHSIFHVCKELEEKRSHEVDGRPNFRELYIRFYKTFSLVAHPTSSSANLMIGVNGRPGIALAYNSRLPEFVGLSMTLGGWIINDIVKAMNHPSAGFICSTVTHVVHDSVSRARSLGS